MRFLGPALIFTIALGIIAFSAGAEGQAVSKTAHSVPGNTAHSPSSRITPQQERGLNLLKAAQAEAANSGPEIRAFVLWQVARSYAKTDPQQQDSLLHEAFRATLSIENPPDNGDCGYEEACNPRGSLQEDILVDLLHRSPEEVQSLLAQADPDVQKYMTGSLLAHDVDQKNFDRAESLLNQFADADDYPFDTAAELMGLLPPERNSDRLTIFSQAFNNFQQHPANVTTVYYDFTTMIVRFWRHLPPEQVTDAMDAILKQASDKDIPGTKSGVNLSTTGGDASFGSLYEYRLFELLPVLEELDRPKAERLLREDAEVRALLDRYPKGLQSLTPADYSDKPLDPKKSGLRRMGVTMGDSMQSAINQTRLQQENDIDHRLTRIKAESTRDPRQALQDALNLPSGGPLGDRSPRAAGLQEVAASAAALHNVTVAREALDEERKCLDGRSPKLQSDALVRIAETYLKLGDPERAKSALSEALKRVDELYRRDDEAGDPNQAFKGLWPSTNSWRHIVRVAGRLSPDFAEEVISGIPDPEIATITKLDYAQSLLGVTQAFQSVIEWHKNGMEGVARSD